MQKNVSRWGAALTGALCLLPCSNGSAQNLDGSYRLTLELPLLAYESSSEDPGAGNEAIDSSTVSWGLDAEGVAVSAARFFGDIQAGVRIAVGGTRSQDDGTSRCATGDTCTTSRLGLQAQGAYVFGSEDLRPFAGLSAGVSRRSNGTFLGTANSSDSTTVFTGGVLVGAHWFASRRLSIDPVLEGLFQRGTRSRNFSDDSQIDTESSVSGFIVRLRIGGSFWVGGSMSRPQPSEPRKLRRRFSGEDFVRRDKKDEGRKRIDPSDFGPSVAAGAEPQPEVPDDIAPEPAAVSQAPADTPAPGRMITELQVRQRVGGWFLGIDGDTISGTETLTLGLARRGPEPEWNKCSIELAAGAERTEIAPQHSFTDGMERATAFVSLDKLDAWLTGEGLTIRMCDSFRRLPRRSVEQLRENLGAFRRGVDFALNVPDQEPAPSETAEATPATAPTETKE